MFWRAICYDEVWCLYGGDPSVQHLRRTCDAISLIYRGQFFILQENARPHVTVDEVLDYLGFVNIPTIDWSLRSPRLNSIEHLWDELK